MVFTVGLTGGIGSGKSTVATLFAELGAYIIDADVIAHQLSLPPSPALEAVAQQFGADYLTKDGTLDRPKMRDLVFNQPTAHQQLDNIFHPLIYQHIHSLLYEKDIVAPYVILAVPLLFESNRYSTMIHRRLVVDCSIELQIARTMHRSSINREMVVKIMATQVSREDRLAQADDIITNDQDLSHLYNQVSLLHHRYLQFRDIT